MSVTQILASVTRLPGYSVISLIISAPVFKNDRTNNLMERYNRHFNGIFTSSHPPLPVFCKALAVECERLLVEKRNVEGSSDVRPERSPINWPVIILGSMRPLILLRLNT